MEDEIQMNNIIAWKSDVNKIWIVGNLDIVVFRRTNGF